MPDDRLPDLEVPTVPMQDLGVTPIVEIIPAGKGSQFASNSASILQAKKFIESVAKGASVTDAAQQTGANLAMLKADTDVRRYVREKMRTLGASAAEIKQFVVLKWLDKAMNGTDDTLQMAALRELSLIPEVGLKGGKGGATGPAGRELSDETGAVLDGLE